MQTLSSEPFIKLRPVQPEDEAFLRHLYAQVNEAALGLMNLETAQRATLLDLQCTAQQQSYTSQFPGAEHSIILFHGTPAGQLYLARTEGEIRLVDISILPQYQSSGIGTSLLRMLQAEATVAGLPIRLSVLRTNQNALRLYSRLGFIVIGADTIYCQMQWSPPLPGAAAMPDAGG